MYYVFETELNYWRNHLVQAAYQGNILDFKQSWWLNEPFAQPVPPLTFTVSAKAPKPDNLFVGTAFSLYSLKLINIIKQWQINFESFPVTIVDKKTKTPIVSSYQAFHLLEVHSAIDPNRSVVIDNGSIRIIEKLTLSQEAVLAAKPLFRTKEYFKLVLIHEKLKANLDQNGITGCTYIPLDEYQSGMYYKDQLQNPAKGLF